MVKRAWGDSDSEEGPNDADLTQPSDLKRGYDLLDQKFLCQDKNILKRSQSEQLLTRDNLRQTFIDDNLSCTSGNSYKYVIELNFDGSLSELDLSKDVSDFGEANVIEAFNLCVDQPRPRCKDDPYSVDSSKDLGRCNDVQKI